MAVPAGDGRPLRCDLLSTAQAGIAGLVMRQDGLIDGVHRWVTAPYAQQSALPTRLYSFLDGAALLTEPGKGLSWLAITAFDAPRQSYYTPGIAAVFLAGWAMQRGDCSALRLGHAFWT